MNLLVQNILDQKKRSSGIDISTQENRIDQLVYELYGLDEEEIQIIENATS